MADLLDKKPTQKDDDPGDYEFYRPEQGSFARWEEDEFLKSVGISRDASKRAGRPPMFSFAVPMKSGGVVAFALAKAGLEGFKAVNYREDDVTEFTFRTEPEMHVGEEIVKQEFAEQIKHHVDWAAWKAQPESPDKLKSERELSPGKFSSLKAQWRGKVAGQWGDRSYDSDQVHDVLDKYRNDDPNNTNISFDDPLPEGSETSVLKDLDGVNEDTYLGVVVWMISHGDKVPAVYRERARQIASAMVRDEAYLNSWQNPKLRKAELEEEIALLEGSDIKTGAADEKQVNRMLAYRRKKLLAWIDELGLDLSDELKRYDEGDFYVKDQVYEEVRDMIKEERKFQSHYRRTMRGPRPYNRKS